MPSKIKIIFFSIFIVAGNTLTAQTPKFKLVPTIAPLTGSVRLSAFFDVVGRKAAVLGKESGTFEAWIFPFQILENFRLQYRFADSPAPDDLSHYAEAIEVLPERTTITYSHPLFTIRQYIFVPVDEPAIIMLLEIDTYRELEIYASFFPRLQPMWPGGMGGQYATWRDDLNAYLISESRRKFNALIGSPNARQQSPPLAHELSQKPILFAMQIKPEEAQKQFYPIVIAADFASREDCIEKYRDLLKNISWQFDATRMHYEKFLQNTLSLTGTEFDVALAWNKLAMHKGFICNPDLGCGMIAGFGTSGTSKRPGFGWYFGGDMFINSLAMAAYGDFDVLKQSFAFLQKYQRADGKIMHELSQSGGMIDWFEDFPYGFIHGDTTPFYLAAMYNFYLHTGDRQFIKNSWPSIKKAYDWCRSTDSDGDGLMENTLAGLGASELGSLREATGVDIYLAAVGVQAWKAYSELAIIAGQKKQESEIALRWHEKGKAALEQKFWNPDTNRYNFSLTQTGAPNPELTAWAAFPMIFHLLPEAHARQTLVEIASSKISTDWGSRMLSNASPAYDPLAYNNGAVWPFLTGFTIWGLYNQQNAEAGLQTLRNLANWITEDALGAMPEITSGAYFRPLETSVPHQMFSSFGFTAGLIRGLLGLSVSAETQTVLFAPQLPPDWGRFRVENITVGADKISFEIAPSEKGIALKIIKKPATPLTIDFRPAFGVFAKLDAVNTTEGVNSKIIVTGRNTRFTVQFDTAEIDSLYLAVDDPLRVWLPYQKPQIGDLPRQMKLIDLDKVSENELAVTLEAPGGSEQILYYRATKNLNVLNAEIRDSTTMVVEFEGDGFVRKKILIKQVESRGR